MKKQSLLIILMLNASWLFAQSNVSFGVRAGLSSAAIRGNAVNNLENLLTSTNGLVTTRNLTGFFAGGYATIPLGTALSLEPGLYYAQKGYELNGELSLKEISFLGLNAKAKIQSNYLDMPVLVKFSTGGFQLFAGPQLSYLLNAGLHTSAGVLGINLLHSKLDATAQFNRWDAALTAGAGYEFASGLNLFASYDYGLLKMDAGRHIGSYNNVIKVGLGVRL